MNPLANLLVFVLVWVVFIGSTFGLGLLLIPVYWVLVFRGQQARAESAMKKLETTLMAQEKLLEKALQLRSRALWNRRLLVAITNSRMILIERSLLGGFTMKDHQWKDLRDAQMSEDVLPHIFGSSLRFHMVSGGGAIVINGIDGGSASKIYAEAQAQEQAWEEKRRIREMEEKRAASGGVFLGGGFSPNTASASSSALEELGNAKKLLDSGAISDAEYNEIKAKILSR